jgi:CHAT domain-containing protein
VLGRQAARVVALVLLTGAAARAGSDPWIDADNAFAADGREAALREAATYKGPDAANLAAYLQAAPKQPEARALLREVEAAVQRRDFAGAVRATEQLGRATLLDARLWKRRAQALSVRNSDPLPAYEVYGDIARKLGWLLGLSDALTIQGRILGDRGEYGKLVELNKELAEVEGRLGRLRSMHGALVDRGACLVEVGRIAEAFALLPASVNVAQKANWVTVEASGRDALAQACWKQGEYADAFDAAEQARELWKRTTNLEGKINNANFLGVLHMELGDFDEAAKIFEKLLEQYGSRIPYLRAMATGNLGVIASYEGRVDDALRLLAESRALFEGFGDEANVAMGDKEIAEVLMRSGRAKKALDHLQKALKAFDSDPVEKAGALAALADASLRAEDPDGARDAVKRAFAVPDSERDRRTRYRLHTVRAGILLAEGKTTDALDALRKAMDLADDTVSGLSDEQTFSVREQRADVFQLAVQCAFRIEEAATIVDCLERTRAAVLRDAIGNRRTLYRSLLPPALAAELREAEAAVVEARLRLLQAIKVGKVKKLVASRALLKKAENELRVLANQAERANKRLAGFERTKPITLAEMKRVLSPGEVIVYFALQGDQARAFIVGAKDSSALALGAADEIRKRCIEARRAFSARNGDPDVDWLIENLVAPLKLPKGTTRVLVCPDGALAFLPWAMLLDDRYGSTIPSATTLKMLRTSKSTGGEAILAFGAPDYSVKAAKKAEERNRGARLVPLPFAKKEVEEIIKLVPGSECFTKSEATENQVRISLGRKWSAIHFACHGVVDYRSPRRSALALTPQGEDDGFLTIPEIMAQQFSTDMVVLSACDSGTGAFVRGEGVLGLARAFMAAGAPRVLASLWKVDDEATKELMVSFHRHRVNGKPPAAALRAAQDDVKAKKKRWQHPRYWAAWVIWGLPD